jgi:DNA-binding XRE family transcriptional regulator
VATSLKRKLRTLEPQRRTQIEKRAAQLMLEEMSLRDLRRALQKTQVSMAKSLSVGQDSVSRIEARSDLLISTLRSYVEAMGGSLQIVAEFPGRPPVAISGVADVARSRKNKASTHHHSRARKSSRPAA